MKVLHISPTYLSAHSVVGGAERYVHGLARAMSRKTETTLLSFGARAFHTVEGELRFCVHKPLGYVAGNRINPLAVSFVPEMLKHDVIHCHQIFTLLTEMVLLVGSLVGRKVFVTDHGGGGRTFLRLLRLRRKARGFLTVSQYSLSQLDLEGVPGAAIYGGIEFERFRPLPLTEKVAGRVVVLGRILPHKGLHHLVEALSEEELIILGTPTDPAYLSEVVAKAASKRVRVVESATDEEVVELLNSAQLAVFPSTRRGPDGHMLPGEPELFGQAPLEAMACGIPALVSDVGSFPEIALPDCPRLMFREGDAQDLREKMSTLMADVDGCVQLGERCLKHVRSTFTWDRTVARCLSAYEKL